MNRMRRVPGILFAWVLFEFFVGGFPLGAQPIQEAISQEELKQKEFEVEIKRAKNQYWDAKKKVEALSESAKKSCDGAAALKKQLEHLSDLGEPAKNLYYKGTPALEAEGHFSDDLKLKVLAADKSCEEIQAKLKKSEIEKKEAKRVLKVARQRRKDYEQAILEGWPQNPF